MEGPWRAMGDWWGVLAWDDASDSGREIEREIEIERQTQKHR